MAGFPYVTNDINITPGNIFFSGLNMACLSTLEPIFSKGCAPMKVKILFLNLSTYSCDPNNSTCAQTFFWKKVHPVWP